jgi:hypothetical protein
MEKTKLYWEDGGELFVNHSLDNAEEILPREMFNMDLHNGIYYTVYPKSIDYFYLENFEWYSIDKNKKLKFLFYSSNLKKRYNVINRENKSGGISII